MSEQSDRPWLQDEAVRAEHVRRQSHCINRSCEGKCADTLVETAWRAAVEACIRDLEMAAAGPGVVFTDLNDETLHAVGDNGMALLQVLIAQFRSLLPPSAAGEREDT